MPNGQIGLEDILMCLRFDRFGLLDWAAIAVPNPEVISFSKGLPCKVVQVHPNKCKLSLRTISG